MEENESLDKLYRKLSRVPAREVIPRLNQPFTKEGVTKQLLEMGWESPEEFQEEADTYWSHIHANRIWSREASCPPDMILARLRFRQALKNK